MLNPVTHLGQFDKFRQSQIFLFYRLIRGRKKRKTWANQALPVTLLSMAKLLFLASFLAWVRAPAMALACSRALD